MAASVQYRQQEMSLVGERVMNNGTDDDLSLFLEMGNSDKKKNGNLEEFDGPLEPEPNNSLISEATLMMVGQNPSADDILNSGDNKADYDWLLTTPGNPVFPSVEMEAQKTSMGQIRNSGANPTSEPADLPAELTSRTNVASRRSAPSNGVNSSNAGIRRPSPSRAPKPTASRHTTPTARPTLPSTTKPSRSSTPTSRATSVSTKPIIPPKRSSTPTRSSARSSTPTVHSSTPTIRSSTPTARSSISNASKPTARSSTPTHRPSNPSFVPSVHAGRSNSVTKSRATTLKNPVPSRGTSPTVKSRPSKNPLEMLALSGEATLNIKAPLSERPASASRGRPAGSTVKLSSIETSSKGRPARNSGSPSRVQVSNGSTNNSGRFGIARGRAYSNRNDDVNPVLMGTEMVERVVNMRKLAPPKQDDHLSNGNNASGKSSSSNDNSGFGRTLSKKSLDMAMRHMDIRRSMPGNLRAMMSKVPASSVYSVRSDSTKSRTISASDSPFTTSGSASSEHSVNNHYGNGDGSEVDDSDLGNENGHFFPTNQHDQ